MHSDEKIIWKGKPSHWMNFKIYVLCFLFCWLVIPVFIAIYHALQAENTVYFLTNERLKIKHGILNVVHNECELYRIRDYQLEEPFFLRMMGKSNVILFTNDMTDNRIVIYGADRGTELLNAIRTLVEYRRMGQIAPAIDFFT